MGRLRTTTSLKASLAKPPPSLMQRWRLFRFSDFSDTLVAAAKNPDYIWRTGVLICLLDFVLCLLVIQLRKYTEIDWVAYMQQVDTFLNGTRNYSQLVGQTGPIVYPIGHLYIYTGLHYLTSAGSNIRLAQYLFAAIYAVNLLFVFRIYHDYKLFHPWLLVLVSFSSYRIHSIYILRLFNDPLAMLFVHCATLLIMHHRWLFGAIAYGIAVSIKMNALLFLPAVGAIYVVALGPFRAVLMLLIPVLINVLLPLPFLLHYPADYFRSSFNFGREFLFEWTVNWRFLPEETFSNKGFHAALLCSHLAVLIFFGFRYWFRARGGLAALLFGDWSKGLRAFLTEPRADLSPTSILFALGTSNFIGIMFSRTLHYQFYVWYYYFTPALLWATLLDTKYRILIWGCIELSWNTFPSTVLSSAILHGSHLVILFALCQRFSSLKMPKRTFAAKIE